MDLTVIQGLTVCTTIGVHPWERRISQRLTLDLELAFAASRAGETDQLADALDYEAITQRLMALGAESDCQLIEAFAEKAATCLLDEFGISAVKLCVWKPDALAAADRIGVVIERQKAP